MIVGEPSLMGGDVDDEDERFISRLENNQFETNPMGHYHASSLSQENNNSAVSMGQHKSVYPSNVGLIQSNAIKREQVAYPVSPALPSMFFSSPSTPNSNVPSHVSISSNDNAVGTSRRMSSTANSSPQAAPTNSNQHQVRLDSLLIDDQRASSRRPACVQLTSRSI
jgi:hypothetical protein